MARLSGNSAGARCLLCRALHLLSVPAFMALLSPSVARGDSPPPLMYLYPPANVTIREGSPLSLVYEFQNASSSPYPFTDSITVAPIPTTDFFGPNGAAEGEFAELDAFAGYQATIGPGQYAQFTLNFTTTGSDYGDGDTWQLHMPPISYSWSVSGMGSLPVWDSFGQPTVTLYQSPVPEPSTLGLFGAMLLCGLTWIWRRRPATG